MSDQVIVSDLRRALSALDSVAPSRISLIVDGHECTGVELSLVVRYGTDLREAAERARTLVLTALDVILGPPAFTRQTATVDVTVDDITPEDPRR